MDRRIRSFSQSVVLQSCTVVLHCSLVLESRILHIQQSGCLLTTYQAKGTKIEVRERREERGAKSPVGSERKRETTLNLVEREEFPYSSHLSFPPLLTVSFGCE